MRYRHHSPSPRGVSTSGVHLSWTIWWDMHRRAGSDGRSRATESSEEEALRRAERFLRLGFVVYEIRDPTGAMHMDEARITDHFAARPHVVVAT
jgi:hypothetical protein